MTRYFVRILDAKRIDTPQAVTQHSFLSFVARRVFVDGLPLQYRELATWEENVSEEGPSNG